jgi:hypothetical protein
MPDTMMDTAQALAEKICYSISPFGIVDAEMIPALALSVLALPTMAEATQEEGQRIFDLLVGCIAAQQVGIHACRTARYRA